MPAFPIGDLISHESAGQNRSRWVLVLADQDYFLLEASLAPGSGSAGSVAGFIAKIRAGDLPSGTGTGGFIGGAPQTFSSTNSTIPTNYEQVYVGNRYNVPPQLTLANILNQSWKEALAAMPMGWPPILRKGDGVVVLSKNLTASAQTMNWNLNAILIPPGARKLIDQYGEGL